jgi:predicted TIM-barrel fold metal-dependent hydrolase
MCAQAITNECLPPERDLVAPKMELPEGACDTHAHVIGPFRDYPLQSERSYTPPEAPVGAYMDMLRQLGMSRGVLVQPSVYGTDNSLVLGVTGASPRMLRAVVVVDAGISSSELRTMHAAGARGFRINLLFKGGVDLDGLERTASKAADLGWHAQLLIDITALPELAGRLARLPIPVVFDHMGHFDARRGTEWDGFRHMLELAQRGNAWVKVSGAYRLGGADAVALVAPVARRLVSEVPERLLWGSDWPHVGLAENMPNTGDLLNAFLDWCETSRTREQILVRNPELLYGLD